MYGSKNPFQSLTINAAAGSAISTAVGLAGVQIDPTLITSGVNAVFQLVSIGLALVAIVGRVRATTTIGKVD